MPEIHFHLPEDWTRDRARMLPFYQKLTAGLPQQAQIRLVPIEREGLLDRIEATAGVHIVNHGRVMHPRALNAGIAYIYPFWHLDPSGIRAFSSIGEAVFRPSQVDGEVARGFFRRLRGRLVEGRTSRYEQPEEIADLGAMKAAVFLQSEGHRTVGETLYLDRWAMLRGVLEAVDGPVAVKPHPRDLDPETGDMLEALQAAYPHLVVTLANIHDVIRAAERVVTINSAVGIEAYLHRKPVILCGKADFHHIATVAKTPEELNRALRAVPEERPYAKYIQWYFGERCLNAGAPDLVERFWARLPPGQGGV